MTEIKLEIGDNLKEVMLEILKKTSGENASIALSVAFGIDFSKILKGIGKKVKVIEQVLGPAPSGLDRTR